MRLYGLIGKPLRHSFSKAYFARKFEDENITDCRYENFELDSIDHLPSLLHTHPDLQGLNVTIPYKKEVIRFLDTSNEIVQATGACNCIRIKEGKRSGYNTDVIGFQKSLQPLLQQHHKKALVLGTGGSSGAVQYGLRQMEISYRLVSRNAGKDLMTYRDIDQDILREYPLIINTTPVGMFPHTAEAPEIPYQYLNKQHLLFDLVYNPEQTLFLQKGTARGAATANGYQMLLLQAEESWDIWNS